MEGDYDGLLEMLLDQTSPMDAPPSTSSIELPPSISLFHSSELELFADPTGGDMQARCPSSPNPSNSAGNSVVNNITFVSTVSQENIVFMPTPPSLSSLPSEVSDSTAPSDNGRNMFSMGPFPLRTYVPPMPATNPAMSLGRQTFFFYLPTSPHPLPGSSIPNYRYDPIFPSYQKEGLLKMASSSSSLPSFFSPFSCSLDTQSHSPVRGLAWSNPELNPIENGMGTTPYLAAKALLKKGRFRTFKCRSCTLEFPNAQAYGGHMSFHSKLMKNEASFSLSVIQNINFKRTQMNHGSSSKGKKPMTSPTKELSFSDGAESNKKKEKEVIQGENYSNKEKSSTEEKEEEDGSSVTFLLEKKNVENPNEEGTMENGSTDNPPIEEQQIENATEGENGSSDNPPSEEQQMENTNDGGTGENGSTDNPTIEEKQIESFGNIGDGEQISNIFNFADESPLDL